MEETTIYIETPLTPKILEGLDDKRRYAVIFSDGGEDFYTKSGILQYIKFVDDVVKITNILQPVKVTKDMVEKGAEDLFPTHHVGDREVLQNFTRDHRGGGEMKKQIELVFIGIVAKNMGLANQSLVVKSGREVFKAVERLTYKQFKAIKRKKLPLKQTTKP